MEGASMRKYSIDPKDISESEHNAIMIGEDKSIDFTKESKYILLRRLVRLLDADEARMIVRVIAGEDTISRVEAVRYLLKELSYEQLLDFTQLEDRGYARD